MARLPQLVFTFFLLWVSSPPTGLSPAALRYTPTWREEIPSLLALASGVAALSLTWYLFRPSRRAGVIFVVAASYLWAWIRLYKIEVAVAALLDVKCRRRVEIDFLGSLGSYRRQCDEHEVARQLHPIWRINLAAPIVYLIPLKEVGQGAGDFCHGFYSHLAWFGSPFALALLFGGILTTTVVVGMMRATVWRGRVSWEK